MAPHDLSHPHAAEPLSYASPAPPALRTSRLAIASVVCAVLGSPCVAGSFLNWLNQHAPTVLGHLGGYHAWRTWTKNWLLIIVTLLPLAAVLRITLSRGRLKGVGIACVGFLISLLWWGLILYAWWIMRDFRMD